MADQTNDVRERAIDAAQAVFDRALKLYGPPRHTVAAAIDAAASVYSEEADRILAVITDTNKEN